jgi:hypothetical protein
MIYLDHNATTAAFASLSVPNCLKSITTGLTQPFLGRHGRGG